MSFINKKKIDAANRQNLIDLVIKLNTKIVFLEREKSKRNMGGKSIQYKAKLSQDLILQFLKKDCQHILNEIPCIKDYNLFDFRKWLSSFDDDSVS